MTHLVPVLRPVLGSPFRRASLYRAAGEMPSWHIAPARTGNVNDLITGSNIITFTNSSPAWGFNSSGVLVQPAANEPFIEHDPATGSALGWRVWGAVTNSIRNNTMQGAVAGTPGTPPTNGAIGTNSNGLSSQVVGTGTENGIDYIDVRFSGTASNSNECFFQNEGAQSIAASNGQTWTASQFMRIVGGSTSNTSAINMIIRYRRSSADVYTYIDGPDLRSVLSASSISINRRILTGTATDSLTGFVQTYTRIIPVSGAAVDITLRIGLPQLQQSATVGPVVKTSTMAATSTADVGDLLSWAVANNIRGAYIRARTTASGTRGLLSGNDNSSSNRIEAITSGTDPRLQVTSSGSSVADINGGTITANTPFRMAMRFDTDSYALSVNGGAVVSDSSGARPTINRWMLGRTQAGDYANGYLEELALFSGAPADARLIAMAAS